MFFKKIKQKLKLSIVDSVNLINQSHWKKVLTASHNEAYKNIYFSTSYLSALETALSGQIQFRYVLFYNADLEPVALAYFQLINISQKEINLQALNQKLRNMLPRHLTKSINFKILICGNAFASGENGFVFARHIMDIEAFFNLSEAQKRISKIEKKNNRNIRINLVKEFWPVSFEKTKWLRKYGYSEIQIDVNMVLKFSKKWHSFEDYLDALNSKFRVKARSVMKRSAALMEIDFTTDNKKQYEEKVNKLYNTIVDNVEFSFGRLNAQTFFELKKNLGDNYLFKGYFLDNKLVGFSSAAIFNGIVDGNFVGLDYKYNQQYSVYQRILYDFVKQAIKTGAQEVRFGRTAEEIKSGVGAEPFPMKFYARHRYKITNAFLKPIVERLKPSPFELRKPFKAKYYS